MILEKRTSAVLICLLGVFVLTTSVFVCPAFADSIGIFNTGESGGTAQTVGQTDTHYELISAPSGVPLTAITTTPNVAWASNTATADWISPGSSGGTGWPIGDYDYRTTFDLTGLNPSTATLTGNWASDNNACLSLNGTATSLCTGFAGFGSLIPFSITGGFHSGINTFDLIVTNGGGPTGVILEVSGQAAPAAAAVPEPSTVVLLGAGFGLIGVIRKRFVG